MIDLLSDDNNCAKQIFDTSRKHDNQKKSNNFQNLLTLKKSELYLKPEQISIDID